MLPFYITVQGENTGYVCNNCLLLVEREGKSVSAKSSEHAYSSVSPLHRRKVIASPLASTRKRRHQQMTASLASKSAYNSKYKLCFRQLLSTGKSAEQAFATIVQEKVHREMSAFIRSCSSDQYPILTDTKSIASFSWPELMNKLQNQLPILHAAVAGSMPKLTDQSTYVIIIIVSINYLTM